jgi:hypothetical protein
VPLQGRGLANDSRELPPCHPGRIRRTGTERMPGERWERPGGSWRLRSGSTAAPPDTESRRRRQPHGSERDRDLGQSGKIRSRDFPWSLFFPPRVPDHKTGQVASSIIKEVVVQWLWPCSRLLQVRGSSLGHLIRTKFFFKKKSCMPLRPAVL